VQHVLPGVIDATVEVGPRALRDGVIAVYASANLEEMIQRWLDQQPLNPFETYLARASASPVLEALTTSTSAISPPPLAGEGQGGGMSKHCPNCGGLPQLSYFAVSGEALVSGPRYLVCSRCANNWIFSRMMCAGCGESSGTKLPIYQEQEQLPHARVDGCQTCRKYLLTFDLRRETRAVPIVDEIAALPLDLYARDHGLTKITPNLMGN
jgi:FdhE protein